MNTSERSRRNILKATGGALASLSLAGCLQMFGTGQDETGTDGEQPSGISAALDPNAYADRFANVVNLVEDYGADPTGEEPIGDSLARAWDDDTLIVVPSGEYKMNEAFRRTRWENVGLIGQNAVIRHGEVERINGHRVTRGEYNGSTMMFRLGTSSNPHQGDLVFGGFIFDWSAENSGMQGVNAFVDGQLEIRNVIFHGLHDLGTHGNLRAATATPESWGIVSNVQMDMGGLHYADTINERSTRRYDGSTQNVGGREVGQSWSTTGVTGHPDMLGTMVFQDIICGPWSGSPIYVRGGEGRKIVTNCYSANGGGNQIRTSGGDAWDPVEWIDGTEDKQEALEGAYGGSVIENCQVWVDQEPRGVHQAQSGLLFQDTLNGVARNCSISLAVTHGTGAAGSYGIGTRGDTDNLRIEDCQIALYDRADAVYVSPLSGSVEIDGLEVQTDGLRIPSSRLFRGVSSMANVAVDGESIA
jgi:hypothetical protein